MNHRFGRAAFAIVVGLLVATFSYKWISNPEGREQRALQVSVVESSRILLKSIIGVDGLQIVDPLAPDRKVGKVYVYPEEIAGKNGWAVSGYYRRDDDDNWHPFLMLLGEDRRLASLKAQDADASLLARAASDPLLEIGP